MWDHAWDSYSDYVDYEIAKSEAEWDKKNWLHTTEAWEKIKLSELSENHIKNIIKYFKIYDLDNRYYKELHNRWIHWRILK